MKKRQFNIKPQEPWSSEDYLPPDDPLGELTDFELGLRRFFYDCNHRVTIEMGHESKDVFLFPDICLLIERLPEKIAVLSQDESPSSSSLSPLCRRVALPSSAFNSNLDRYLSTPE